MPTKKFITAGAGSGKTYTVTTEVAKLVKNSGLRPEQVIMTTFTKAAAQELREKAKKELVKIGCAKEAQQMEHALIGTVHSVANTFLTKYWYLLGITPDASAIEEDEMQSFRDQSLRGLLQGNDKKFIFDYCERYEIPYSPKEHKSGLNYELWRTDLCKVLDYMQWYNISDAQLDDSLKKTTEDIIKLLEPEPGKGIDCPPASLHTTYNQALKAVDSARKSAKKDKQQQFLLSFKFDALTPESLEEFSTIIEDRKINSPESMEVQEWISGILLFPVSTAADHRRYAEIIFRLAKKWRDMYRAFKDQHHLIDFNDMEEMFLKLLDMEEVQEDIKSRYSCLYVDEFQDSNPIQVSIFQELSKHIDTCYVGDKKQAIYGFRGSDTELTTAVADSIADKHTLPYSYRSIEPLVTFSNTVFTKVFQGMSDVTLKMPPTNGNTDKEDHPLRLWQWDKDADLAFQIKQFLLHEKIESKDVAVLAHSNEQLDKLAEELRSIGVSVCRENDNIKDSRTGRLVKALLTLMTTPGNLLARAEVAYLTEPGYYLTNIIEERLDNISDATVTDKDYLQKLPILSRLNHIRSDIKAQSVSAMLETLVIELNLYALVHSWDNANAEETNLQVFIDLARKYEDSATKLARPATVAGFIDYFCNQKQKGAADNNGVRLFTYHKSKGLEWKVVIMLSLDKNVKDADKIAKNRMLGCHNHRTQPPTAQNPNPTMTVSLVRNIYAQSPQSQLPSAILSRLQQHPRWDAICEAERSEQARLLYVGVTRARNILILAAKGKDSNINLNWFSSVGLDNVKQELTDDKVQDVLGIGIPFLIEKPDLTNILDWGKKTPGTILNIASDYSALDKVRNLSPSKVGKTPHGLGKILNDKELRIPENIARDEQTYARLGDFIHNVFCCMDDGITDERIKSLRQDYGFSAKEFPNPEKLAEAWQFLITQLEREYGSSVNRIHELPFRHLDADGHLVTGFMDFVWETNDAYVIVDYKTDASNCKLIFNPDSEHYAGCHGDQLDCYQRALEASNTKPVKARLIYYPITRFLVEVK